MRWWLLAVGFLLAMMAGAAEAPALVKAGPGVSGRGLNVRLGPAAPALPGDTVAFTAWWGLRAYSAAQLGGTTNAVRVRRASDNFEYDIKILPSGELDVGPGSGPLDHCTSTSCFVSIFYDQRGGTACSGGCNMVQTVQANQPQFIFNCNGTKPCIQIANTTTMALNSVGAHTPATGVASLVMVANRSAGTGVVTALHHTLNATRLNTQAANTWRLFGGASGTIDRSAADAAWHVGVGVVNGAASSLRIDDGTTTGTAAGNTTAGLMRFGGATAATTVRLMEGGVIDNVALPEATQAALTAGARSWYELP